MDRRSFLSSAALLASPGILFAQAATERRFIFIIQRGAADGLNTLIPYADPAYASARGALAIDASSALKLDGTFALHPSLGHLQKLYGAGQAILFHARLASAYRDRSHFDGQNVLETGGRTPYQVKDGWMNRLLSKLPRNGKEAIAFSPAIPMAFRGPMPVTSYAPSSLPQANDEFDDAGVGQLYAEDRQLHCALGHPLWRRARHVRGRQRRAKNRQDATSLGRMAAAFLSQADGPRLAMIETGGWGQRTSGQSGTRLATQLRNLDNLLAGLQEGMGVELGQNRQVLVSHRIWSDSGGQRNGRH